MWTVAEKIPIRLAVIELDNVCVRNDRRGFERLQECASSYAVLRKKADLFASRANDICGDSVVTKQIVP